MLGMMLALLVPFILTLQTIKQPRPRIIDLQANPTPYGYTWSLSLFIVPTLLLAIWHSRRKDTTLQKRTFWTTAALVAGAGIMLDVLFGLRFFTFENPEATLGFRFWGLDPAGGFKRSLPIEEIGFYSFGIITVLLVYIWGDEFWFGAYNRDDSPRKCFPSTQSRSSSASLFSCSDGSTKSMVRIPGMKAFRVISCF